MYGVIILNREEHSVKYWVTETGYFYRQYSFQKSPIRVSEQEYLDAQEEFYNM